MKEKIKDIIRLLASIPKGKKKKETDKFYLLKIKSLRKCLLMRMLGLSPHTCKDGSKWIAGCL